jgi:alanine dehydrogenase
MIIGVPKEIKTNENRVALVPAGVESLVGQGHTVHVEQGAGEGSGFPDAAYVAAGATILPTADDVWAKAEMIFKVKEPIAVEWPRMRKGQLIYTYFHFAADEALTRAVIGSGAVAVAYETVQLPSGELPLLTPMSEVAGRMAVQEGAKYLEKHYGGSGILLGGVPGVAPGRVVIIGGGVVGTNAAKMAAGLGAHVTILDISLERLRYLDDVMPANVDTAYSNRYNILEQISTADLVVGAVLLPGAKAPNLVKRADLKRMKPGSVIVDVAAEQGGNCELTRPGEAGTHHGVTVLGPVNVASAVPNHASQMHARNVANFLALLVKKGALAVDLSDQIVRETLVAKDGAVVHPRLRETLRLPPLDQPAVTATG